MGAKDPTRKFAPPYVLFFSVTIRRLSKTDELDNLRIANANRANWRVSIYHEDYRLSPSYTKPANPYLITNANTVPAT